MKRTFIATINFVESPSKKIRRRIEFIASKYGGNKTGSGQDNIRFEFEWLGKLENFEKETEKIKEAAGIEEIKVSCLI